MLKIKQKVQNIFHKRIGGKFTRAEIIDLIVNNYPGTNRRSVIPSDYCYNRINSGDRFNFHFFKWLGKDQYLCLGLNYPYTGTISWRPKHEAQDKSVGEWKDGSYKLWEDPRQL